MKAKSELLRDIGAVLAWAELEMEITRYPDRDEVQLRAMLESKYHVYSRYPGAAWQDAIRGKIDHKLRRELIKKLYLRHRYTTRPTSENVPAAKRHPRLKARAIDVPNVSQRLSLAKRLEETQEDIWRRLAEFEGRYESPKLVLLELVAPKYYRRLMTLQKRLNSLVAEASRDRTDVKQTALLELLDPVLEELGG